MKQIASVFILLCFSISLLAQYNHPPVLEKDKVAYLFTYFTGNKQVQEQVHFAISMDGYNYRALNNNQPVLDSKVISSSGGVRDPHILRCEDGHTFYMVCTDMVTSQGWDSNRAMVLLKSNDLVNWTSSVVNIQKKYKGHEKLKRVWAPQTIFDPEVGKYMVYWSMKHGDANDIIYYAYANDEFTDLITEPQALFKNEVDKHYIDGDIILKDSLFHLFMKSGDKNENGIRLATSKSLSSGNWNFYPGFVESTTEDVEGSGLFKLSNSDEYILMYDVYRKHRYEFTKSKNLKDFEVIDQQISMDFHPRHGTIMAINRSELKSLTQKWGTPEGFPTANHNPVLEGFYADPDIIYSNKHKKYFLYPTSDGFNNWSGTYFKTFSSENLVDWKDEGVILDLQKDVSWANNNAWAPCIIEKKKGRKYQYYYYFTAEKFIGVAVSDDPAGPFVDSGQRIIDHKPQGTNRGIEIDPAVFHDPVSKKDFFYWGNGYLAVAELNKDMVSIDEASTKLITPKDGTFREGTAVFYRKGTYYFLWSENDTRSVDYRVRYGTSTSPTGPINIPENNLILSKDEAQGIYGTGHNSILQIPGKDEWYMVYHRFNYPNGIDMGRAAGYHREVCIDRMTFNADGSIKKIIPTHKGITELK